ncbi:hypothetical protein KAH27_03075 [bacterium]|nr:hypothetical protein [bacterium]
MTKKILIIFILAANVFADNQPVILAARTILRQGKLQFGVRNNTRSNVAGVIKFENATGMELLANGFGFELGPKETEYRFIPIRNTTKDLPSLTCDVVIFNNVKSRLYKNKIQCKSGALFRDIGVSEITSKFSKPAKIKILRGKGLEKNKLSFYFQEKLLIKSFNYWLGNFQIQWEKINTKNGIEFAGKAYDNYVFSESNVVANVKLSIKQNNRGDCMVVFSYVLLKELSYDARNPFIDLDIPRRLAEDDLATLKYDNGQTKLVFLDEVSDLTKIDKSISEFSVITKKDWMTFYMDSSYLTAWNILPKRTPDKRAGLIRLRIRSRVEWKSPFLPNRAGTIQFFIHFPVAVKK